jgi:hypothetical protein
MTRAAGIALVAVLPVALGACESNQARSARIARAGSHLIATRAALKITAPSRTIRVGRTAVLRGSRGSAAVAVELRNTGATARAGFPVLVDVRGTAGTSLYRNDQAGIQPSLQRMGTIRAGRTEWWVDDQVTSTAPPAKVSAEAGDGAAVAHPPRVALRHVAFASDASGRFLTGTVVNASTTALADVPIYAVALRGGRVRAAGRAIVPALPPAGRGKPVHFALYLTGDARGAHLALSVAPTIPGAGVPSS